MNAYFRKIRRNFQKSIFIFLTDFKLVFTNRRDEAAVRPTKYPLNFSEPVPIK
jgi:hypothetical protein